MYKRIYIKIYNSSSSSNIITHQFTQNDTKENIKLENARPWWNTWFLVQEIHLHWWQTSTRNGQMPTRSTCTQMEDERKDHIDPEGPNQRNCPKQLQTLNLPTDDVENINSSNKGRYLLFANKPWIVPWGAQRMPQRIHRHRRVTLHRSAHPKREQDLREKSRYSLDWLQKGIWFGSTKLDNKLPQNIQNIRGSHKFYRKNYENLESGTDSRREKLSWSKGPKRYISSRCTITVTIHNCHDATWPHT